MMQIKNYLKASFQDGGQFSTQIRSFLSNFIRHEVSIMQKSFDAHQNVFIKKLKNVFIKALTHLSDFRPSSEKAVGLISLLLSPQGGQKSVSNTPQQPQS